MEHHIDSDMLPQEKTGRPENFEENPPDRLSPLTHDKELTRTGSSGILLKRKPFIKGLVIRCVFVLIAIAALTGHFQNTTNRIMGPVWDYDQAYLERTLKNIGGSLFVLSIPKGILEMAKTIEVEPSVVGSKAGSIKVGEILEPYMHIIDDIWDFLVLSTYLVLGQLAALELIQLVAIKFFLGFGAIACAVQYNRHTFFGKLGLTMILLFALTYVFYPLTLSMAAQTYEGHQIETSTQLSENLGILKEQASDIDLSVGKLKENIKLIPEMLGQGIRTAWDAALGLIVGLILMFILLPLLTLGSIYMIAKRALIYLDMPDISDKIDHNTRHLASNIGSRTRLSL